MNTASLVAIVAFITLFVVLMLGTSAWIIYLAVRLSRDIRTAESSIRQLLADAEAASITHREKLLGLYQGLTDLTTDHQSSLESIAQSLAADSQLTLTSLRTILESHRTSTDAQIAKINGEELSAAAKIAQSSARRIELAGAAIAELARALLSEDAITRSGLSATDVDDQGYARGDGTSWTQSNPVAAQDALAIMQENSDNATEFEG